MKQDDIIIIGAGWAGLSCAIKLTQAGKQVRIIEAAKHVGGRARKITYKSQTLDNGQHLLLGAYQKILTLLKELDIKEKDVLKRCPLELDIYSPDKNNILLTPPALPAPLHLIAGLLSMQGMTLSERFEAIKLSLSMSLSGFKLKKDTSVLTYLEKHQQSKKVISYLWEPLCLAALNTPIRSASMQIFMTVIKDSFSKRRQDSDMLIPYPDLNAVFPDPALHFLQKNNANISTSCKANSINMEDHSVLTDKGIFKAKQIVIATPPVAAARLIKDIYSCSETCEKLQVFNYQPIITVYLQYTPQTRLGKDIRGMVGTIGQWVFDRHLNQQDGLMAVVISGPGKHTEMDNAQLGTTIEQELARMNPNWPKPDTVYILREKRATFDCSVNTLRPENHLMAKSLWLAGDYTDTGYPATLEGAVMSGIKVAHQICKNT